MRHKSLLNILALFCVGLIAASCDQKPVSIAPETQVGNWRSIAEGSYNLDSVVDCVWGFDDGVVIVGDGLGTVARFDGTDWIDPLVRLGERVTDIWGVASDDFYVLTVSKLFRYQRGDWNEVGPGGSALWGEISNSLFHVGDDGICLYDGSSWAVIDTTEGRLVQGIWGTSAGDVFFASNEGLLHFDGDTLVTIPGAPDVIYNDVWGASSSDVFMVGQDFTIVHYDGNTITTMITESGTSPLYQIWGFGTDIVYVTGTGFFLYYDGISWALDDPFSLRSYRGIWGSSPTDIFFGGYHDEVIRYDGENEVLIRGIRADQIHALWTIPSSGDLVTSDGVRMFHFDGARWEELPANRRSAVKYLWGNSIDNLYASGCPRITRFDGDQWDTVVSLPFYPTAVWSYNDSITYLAGPGVLSFDGADWVTVLDNVSGIKSLHGSSPSNVYAVGSKSGKGFVLRYNGDIWEYIAKDYKYVFKDVWAVSETEVYAVGFFDGVLKFDGYKWQFEPLDSAMRDFRALWGDSRENIYCGGVDHLMHFDGSVWSPILDRSGQIFTHLTGMSGGPVYAVINYGDILLNQEP